MVPGDESRIIIRKARPEDAPALTVLYHELVGDSAINVMPGQVERMAESASSFLLVGVHDGEVCATVLLTICRDAMYGDQPFGVIENLVVTASRRGAGIGKMLTDHIDKIAMEHRCTKLMLLSSAYRWEAHAFFRSQGYSFDNKVGFVRYASAFGAAPADQVKESGEGDLPEV